MRPRYTTILLTLSLTLPGRAQPTLTSGQLAYQVGDVFNYLTCGPASFPSTGENLTWYYNDLSGSPSGMVNIVDPSTTIGFPSFPAATVADQYPGFENALYYSYSPTEDHYLGYWGSAFSYGICTDPRTDMVYPFTYGSSFTDSLVCDETDVYNRVRYGETTVSCVGYGTLVLPYGTFADCLLIHKHWVYFDDYELLVPGYVEGDSYSFIKPGMRAALYSVSYSTYTQDGTTIVNQGSSLLDEMSTGVMPALEDGAALTVLPNPTHGELIIERDQPTMADLVVTAADGRTILRSRLSDGLARSTISLADAPAGVYFVRMLEGAHLRTVRVVKE